MTKNTASVSLRYFEFQVGEYPADKIDEKNPEMLAKKIIEQVPMLFKYYSPSLRSGSL
jgi:hypothetical protein